ncbi:Protein DA1-related 1 [Zea mays]|uniref:Protein DA1-related 1 n=1 Tax=Zea mays TaxID=4577 RepID=A0A317YJD9_MAIZE|nr:Protein DA1-related 1 [Zea mays]
MSPPFHPRRPCTAVAPAPPSSLPRSSLIRKPWRTSIPTPVAFVRCFHIHHRMSPLLGFFADEDDDIEFMLMLRQFERISDVREILDVMPQQNVVFWTMVAVGFSKGNTHSMCLYQAMLLRLMLRTLLSLHHKRSMVRGGIPGRTSMTEIVTMARPQAKVWNISVTSSTALPGIGDSVISNTVNLASKNIEFYEGMNMKVEQQVPLLLVERQALNEAMEAEKSVHHLPQIRGICLSEEQIVRTILKGPIGPGNRIIDMVTGPYKLIRRCEMTAILILYALPSFPLMKVDSSANPVVACPRQSGQSDRICLQLPDRGLVHSSCEAIRGVQRVFLF